MYEANTNVRAFNYFAPSRALYTRHLHEDFTLPSVSTLTKIISSIAKQEDSVLLDGIFSSLEDKQKYCVLLHDEIYVKKMLTYHGGTVYGKSANNPNVLADTVLGIMVNCLHGGPTFISKMIPVSKMNTDFLKTQVEINSEALVKAGGEVIAIISDGN